MKYLCTETYINPWDPPIRNGEIIDAFEAIIDGCTFYVTRSKSDYGRVVLSQYEISMHFTILDKEINQRLDKLLQDENNI